MGASIPMEFVPLLRGRYQPCFRDLMPPKDSPPKIEDSLWVENPLAGILKFVWPGANPYFRSADLKVRGCLLVVSSSLPIQATATVLASLRPFLSGKNATSLSSPIAQVA